MRRLACARAAVALTVTLGACSQGNSGDGPAAAGAPPPPLSALIGTFLRFPNPQVQADGTQQTNTLAYAQAYYEAIDPTNAKDTFAKWLAANGFGSGTGTEASVVFGDVRDLGYGRRMTGRQNPDGTVAFYVENYVVTAGASYSYSTLNLEAAVVRDRRWHVLHQRDRVQPGPGRGARFPQVLQLQSRQRAAGAHGQHGRPRPEGVTDRLRELPRRARRSADTRRRPRAGPSSRSSRGLPRARVAIRSRR